MNRREAFSPSRARAVRPRHVEHAAARTYLHAIPLLCGANINSGDSKGRGSGPQTLGGVLLLLRVVLRPATHMARILALSSHVAFGSVGLAAIVPALQALGHEVVALPTVVLSNHPGYRSHAGEETAPAMLDRMFESLETNGWLSGIDAVLTGYLPTPAHVEMARNAIERIRAENPAHALHLRSGVRRRSRRLLPGGGNGRRHPRAPPAARRCRDAEPAGAVVARRRAGRRPRKRRPCRACPRGADRAGDLHPGRRGSPRHCSSAARWRAPAT